MKKLSCLWLVVWAGAAITSFAMAGDGRPSMFVCSAEIQQRDHWITSHLCNAAAPQLPFSFVYDGRDCAEILAAWQKTFATTRLDEHRTQHVLTWNDPQTGLEVRCVAIEYADFPAVEWTLYFKNIGAQNSPLLQDVRGIDAIIPGNGNRPFVLRGMKGDCCAADNYEPYEYVIRPGDAKRFAPVGGRPTTGANGWPYFNVQTPDQGLLLAVGWPGQWAASFHHERDHGLRIVAGQELTHLSLRPGEQIRTPLIVLLFWTGSDPVRAQNLWRRWFMTHNIPRRNGKLPEPFLTAVGNMGDIPEGERWFRDRMEAVNRTGAAWNLCWIDAGWYPCHGKWEETGTWEIDRTRYPHGFRPLSDALHAHGKKLIVWFEPERVRDPQCWLATKHPEWLLGFAVPTEPQGPPATYWPRGWDKLLNLGDPAAWAWATEHFDRMIKSEGIDVYRQDFNIEPLPYWRRNDLPDRQGITENLYVQGYLAYLDALLARNPSIWSDVSASGGRRNDLETLRRALPLRRSDYEFPNATAEAMQAQTHSLSAWLPYYGVLGPTTPTYFARSTYLPALVLPSNSDISPKMLPEFRRVCSEYRRVAPLMLCDYYPLTPYTLNDDRWIAWQFDRREQGDGVVQAFRRGRGNEPSTTFRLRGLLPTVQYEVMNLDSKTRMRIPGKDLMEKGLAIEIKEQPGARIVTYRRADDTNP